MREETKGARRAAEIAEPIVRTMIVAQQEARIAADRLKYCGLCYHENQSTSQGYVGPPVQRLDGSGPRFTVLPLSRVEPRPGMEIHATDGEAYTLPLNFTDDWFAVVSPKGRKLIP